MAVRRSAHSPAEALTKGKKGDALESILGTGSLRHPVEEWVVRRGDVKGRLRERRERECRSLDELAHGEHGNADMEEMVGKRDVGPGADDMVDDAENCDVHASAEDMVDDVEKRGVQASADEMVDDNLGAQGGGH